MDLQTNKPPSKTKNPAADLSQIPNKEQLSAIKATLSYLTKYEYNAVALALIGLCQPEASFGNHAERTHARLIRMLARAAKSLARPDARPDARTKAQPNTRSNSGRPSTEHEPPHTRDHNQITRQAQDLLITQWTALDPSHRTLALSIEGIDWPARAKAVLEREPGLIAPVAQLLTDHAAAHTPARADHPRAATRSAEPAPTTPKTSVSPLDTQTLRLMLASGNRDAVASAQAILLTTIRAGFGHQNPTTRALRDAVAAAHAALRTPEALDRAPLIRAALRLLDHPVNDPLGSARSPIRAILADPDDPAFGALRRALKRDPSPEARRIAWRELAPGPLAIACLERLGNSRDTAEHNAVLENAHLIANPARRDLLASLGTPGSARRGKAGHGASRHIAALAPILPPPSAPIGALAEVGLATLLAHADTRSAREIRERLLIADEPRARLVCARLASTADLADLTFDPHPAVALVATLRRSTAGVRTPGSPAGTHTDTTESPRTRHTRLLARSPHESVRRVARADLDAGALLDAQGVPTVRAITLARQDAGALAMDLARLLDSRETDLRVRAIRAAVRLRIADRFTDRLAEILSRPAADAEEARVAATAAAALGSIPSRATLQIVMDAMNRPDPRVRANAVESLERITRMIDTGQIQGPSQEPAARLTEIKHSGEHRARANAVRALERLRLADASVTHADLAEILTDDRAPHRLAGAWLAERLLCDPRRVRGPGDADWQTAARCVASLARDEHDPHVRARAVRCARRLLDEINNPRRAQRDPAIDRTARRIRALADRHASPDSFTGETAPGTTATAAPTTGTPGAAQEPVAGGPA